MHQAGIWCGLICTRRALLGSCFVLSPFPPGLRAVVALTPACLGHRTARPDATWFNKSFAVSEPPSSGLVLWLCAVCGVLAFCLCVCAGTATCRAAFAMRGVQVPSSQDLSAPCIHVQHRGVVAEQHPAQ